MNDLDAFIHSFVPGTTEDGRALLVLHGTGGDETDLLPLASDLAPGAALLSPRGQVLERGMPRFFRRHAEGVLDAADLVARAHGLADWVEAAAAEYGLDPARLYAFGYSNGANIAAAMLLLRPGTVAGALLLRPMALPIAEPVRGPSVPVRILSGGRDPIVPAASADALADALRAAGNTVEATTAPTGGHSPTAAEIALGTAWLDRHFATQAVA